MPLKKGAWQELSRELRQTDGLEGRISDPTRYWDAVYLARTKRLGRTCRNPSDGINKKASIERLLTEIRARSVEKTKTKTKYVELTKDYQGQKAVVTTFKSKGIKEGNNISRVQ